MLDAAQDRFSKKWIIEVDPDQNEKIKSACINKNYPLIEEYDFKKDKTNPDLGIELKSTTQIRPY